MPTVDMYYTPKTLKVGDFALVPKLPEGVAITDPTTTPMELVLIIDKQGEDEKVCFTCLCWDEKLYTSERRVHEIFLQCCEGVGKHPKHVCIKPIRVLND